MDLNITQGTLTSTNLDLSQFTPVSLQGGSLLDVSALMTSHNLPEGWLANFLAGLEQGNAATLQLPEGWLENVLAHVASGDMIQLAASPLGALALSSLELSQHPLDMGAVQLVGVPLAIDGIQQLIA